MLTPTFRRVVSLCDQNVRCIEIPFSDDSDLRQFHQAVVMPTLFPVGIEIQRAGIVAFFSIPDEVVIGFIIRLMIFVICEIFLVQVTILYPIVVLLVFDGIIQIFFAEHQLVV